LELFTDKTLDIKENILSKDLPIEFTKLLKDKDRKDLREFHYVMTVYLKFRTYPTQQGPHTGRLDIEFKAYVLNQDEFDILQKMREDNVKDSMLNIAKNLTDSSLEQLKADIDYFTKEKPKEEEEKPLFEDLYNDFKKTFLGQTRAEKEKEIKEKEAEEKEEKKEHLKELWEQGIPEDNEHEVVVRDLTELEAAKACFAAFDTFKKSQGLASFPSPFDDPDAYKRVRQRIAEVKATMNIKEDDRKVKDLSVDLFKKQSSFTPGKVL
jgi:hypothetical protein